jgi:hypothetical protein
LSISFWLVRKYFFIKIEIFEQLTKISLFLHRLSPDGEIGRHASLRGWCPYGCASSSLVLGTKETSKEIWEFFYAFTNLTTPSISPTPPSWRGFRELSEAKSERAATNLLLEYISTITFALKLFTPL